MRVIVAHNLYSSAQLSGENMAVQAEISNLTAAGVTVFPYLRSSDEIPTLPLASRAALPISPVYARRAQKDLSVLITAHRPDVLHLHNAYPLLSPWVIRTAHHHGVPVVQTVHNFRHACVAGVFFRDGRPCHDCSGLRFALPAVRHRCYRGSVPQSAVMATTLALHRKTWLQADRFIALTPPMVTFLRSIGARKDQIVVRPNAVADPGVATNRGHGFLFGGRLSPEKGLELLLGAWSRHPAGSLGPLRIAGNGVLRPLVEALAAQRSDVHYAGELDKTQMGRAISEAAVVIVPSTSDDVLPTVAVEALAHGRPVLATDRGGLPWIVGKDAPQPAGWLVEPQVEALAAALPIARDAGAAMSGAARAAYECRLSPKVLTEQLLEIYRQVSATGRP